MADLASEEEEEDEETGHQAVGGTWDLPGLVNIQKTMENHHF
jgi:hypothetical protein